MKKNIKIVGVILILAIIICGIVFAVNNKKQSEEGKEGSKEHTFNSNNEIKTALTLKEFGPMRKAEIAARNKSKN